ncbi:hypothetical protein AB0392_32325 [Nonomuraea angiospora]|uniref:hypothetical protein n=1 Tax=Nonomuraea angiospora TaxID=46172 RepID=UPI00344D2FA1
MLILPFTDLPDNFHHVSPTNSTRVTSSQRYRLSWTTIIERSDPRFDALTEVFMGEFRPIDTFGVAGTESQEHSVLWFGPADIIARFEANPAAGIPWDEFNQQGVRADRWPNDDAWQQVIPATTWNPDGQGIVAEYSFDDGGSVVVYEMLGRPALLSSGVSKSPNGPTPLVTFHCTRCHEESGHHDRYMSARPDDRRIVCQQARRHMRPGRCGGAEANARNDRMVAVVQEAFGRPVTGSTEGLYAAQCATKDLDPNGILVSSSCAEVREARTHTARHHATAGERA